MVWLLLPSSLDSSCTTVPNCLSGFFLYLSLRSLFSPCGAEGWTWGLTYTIHMVYHWTIPSATRFSLSWGFKHTVNFLWKAVSSLLCLSFEYQPTITLPGRPILTRSNCPVINSLSFFSIVFITVAGLNLFIYLKFMSDFLNTLRAQWGPSLILITTVFLKGNRMHGEIQDFNIYD